MKIQTQKAFTLIEVLLVVGVISLFSTAFFYNATEAKQKADDAHMITEARQVKNAIELYKLDHNGRVPGQSMTGTLAHESEGDYTNAMNELVTDGYLPSVPTSPDGDSYAYGVSEDGLSDLFAADLNVGDDDVCDPGNSEDLENMCKKVFEDEDDQGGDEGEGDAGDDGAEESLHEFLEDGDPYTLYLTGINEVVNLEPNKNYTVAYANSLVRVEYNVNGGSGPDNETRFTDLDGVSQYLYVNSSPNCWLSGVINGRVSPGVTAVCVGFGSPSIETIRVTNSDPENGIVNVVGY